MHGILVRVACGVAAPTYNEVASKDAADTRSFDDELRFSMLKRIYIQTSHQSCAISNACDQPTYATLFMHFFNEPILPSDPSLTHAIAVKSACVSVPHPIKWLTTLIG